MPRSIHNRLALAADLLNQVASGDLPNDNATRAAARDSAAAIQTVVAPGGWVKLRSRTAESTEATENLPLAMPGNVKDALVEAGEEFGVVFTHVAVEGFRKVLAGEWMPPKTPRGQSGRTTKQKVLNIRVSSDLMAQVNKMASDLSKRAGYRVTKSSIAIGFLAEELGVDRGFGESMTVLLPKPVRDHFLAAAEAREDLEQIIDQGLRNLLSGETTLPLPRRWPSGPDGPVKTGKLVIRVDENLRQQLHEQNADLTERLGYRAFPGRLARAILAARLGEPAPE